MDDRNNLDKLAELAASLTSLEFKFHQSDAMLASVVVGLCHAVVVKDFGGIITAWNPAAEDIYGWKSNEILGKHISEIVPEERQEELFWLMSKVKNGESVKSLKTQRKHKDGHLIDLTITVSPMWDSRGQIIAASSLVVEA